MRRTIVFFMCALPVWNILAKDPPEYETPVSPPFLTCSTRAKDDLFGQVSANLSLCFANTLDHPYLPNSRRKILSDCTPALRPADVVEDGRQYLYCGTVGITASVLSLKMSSTT